jgi:cytochrome P450
MTTTDDLSALHKPLLALDQDALRCPHLQFGPLREATPVHFVPELGMAMVTRYDDVLEAVRNPEVYSSQMPTGPEFMQNMMQAVMEIVQERPEIAALMGRSDGSFTQAVLLSADPPVHSRQRKLVNRAFGPKRVASMEAGIEEITNDLIDAFIADGKVEFVKQFGVPLPLTVIADALGVPREHMPQFKKWSDDFVVAIGNNHLTKDQVADMLTSQADFAAYFAKKIEERRVEPHDDLITDVVHSVVDDEELTVGEMLGMFSQFLVAGNETTTKLLASGMKLLLDNPDQMKLVRDDPSLIPNLVEEVLRLEAPVQGLFRIPQVDVEIGGVPIKAGTPLMMVYASANRDPSLFPEPDRLDVTRDNSKLHLGFGQGPHYCLGATLARAEGRIGFETLLRRLDNIRFAPENTFEYEESYVLHGLKQLHLTFEATG